MVPVLGWEVEEGEQRFAILRQASDRLVVLGAVFVGKHVDGGLGRRAGRRAVNLAKVGFHVDLNRESDLVQHVGGLVNPTALVPGAREDRFDCLPEAERAVADGRTSRTEPPSSAHSPGQFGASSAGSSSGRPWLTCSFRRRASYRRSGSPKPS